MQNKAGALLATLAILFAGAPAAHAETAAELIKKSRDWSAYKHEASGKKVCFAASQPKDSAPKGLNRSDVFIYLSFFPADGVKNEVSIRIGYDFKKGSDVTVQVDAASFKFFTKSDKAFIENEDVEHKFVEALKKGNKMVVRGTPAKGNPTTDVFSLLGLSDALKLAEDACSS